MHIDADSLIEHDASLNIESINPCSALSGIEKPRFTMSVVVIAKSLNRRGLPLIASLPIQKVREPRLMSDCIASSFL
jgi:hypothetical protein